MLVDSLATAKVLVVGDVMLDRFVSGEVDRVSPEAPALVVRVAAIDSMPGGAANVAMNIASLGGEARLVGLVGADTAGEELASFFATCGRRVVDRTIRLPGMMTTEKVRYVARGRHLLRADREVSSLPAEGLSHIVEGARSALERVGAVVLSDYAKGVITPETSRAVIHEAHRRGIPVIADPKRRNFATYAGADILTPNVAELRFATGYDCDDLGSCAIAAREVIRSIGCSILLTRGADGIALFQTDGSVWVDEAETDVVRDVSGAGDTVAAVCAAALAAGAELREAAHAANLAAGLAVGKVGTRPVLPDELNLALLKASDAASPESKLVSLQTLAMMRRSWASQELEVGFTNGCFDLLHPGHVQLLNEARARCDRLIVALNADDSVKRLKGPDRPIQTQHARAVVVGALGSVDAVVFFDEDTPLSLIQELRPDVLVKGADYSLEEVVGAQEVIGYGGRVELIELVANESSTRLIARSSRKLAADSAIPED